MQLRILFFLLMAGISVSTDSAAAYRGWHHLYALKTVTESDTRVIHDGSFINQNPEKYRFSVATRREELSRLASFSTGSDGYEGLPEGMKKKILEPQELPPAVEDDDVNGSCNSALQRSSDAILSISPPPCKFQAGFGAVMAEMQRRPR